ncbi:MAG: plasmid pRiA4b ORF-3 family protein, partial [Actinomycetes bacterium]|nr:plasmid pRiA4b ORF-3 family protein [Actinomycetes bacterium]MDX5381088.1 plasmid pRiA4b ORF-3 family protein [Actinomycetes bacterium]MDX5400293.1 plasmid pRiA4b ORF-3 family protein [Actinomycetes bacterium]MDX5450842.1 plasmid pRiA4b ORF-3 family protein [Actinomycetes bacterium]
MSDRNNDIRPINRVRAQQWETADVVAGPPRPPVLKERRSELVILAVRVHLAGAKPQIWRRLRLPSDLTLDRLHLVLRAAMGWEDHAAHHFQVEPVEGQPVAEFRAVDAPGDPSVPDESVVRLDEVLAEPGDRLHYLYHPGDNWHHVIRLEHVYPVSPLQRASDPKCVEGRGTCPLEGVGGIRVWNQVRAVQTGRAPAASVDADLLRRILLAREHRPFDTADADLRVAFCLTTTARPWMRPTSTSRQRPAAVHDDDGSRWAPRPRAGMVDFTCVLDAGYLHFLDPAFAPFWCPECEASYCGDHWR